jgi:hypothetical protein
VSAPARLTLLIQSRPGSPATRYLDAHAERVAFERKLARILLEPGEPLPKQPKGRRGVLIGFRSAEDDLRRLRALPAVARGASSAIPGTDPLRRCSRAGGVRLREEPRPDSASAADRRTRVERAVAPSLRFSAGLYVGSARSVHAFARGRASVCGGGLRLAMRHETEDARRPAFQGARRAEVGGGPPRPATPASGCGFRWLSLHRRPQPTCIGPSAQPAQIAHNRLPLVIEVRDAVLACDVPRSPTSARQALRRRAAAASQIASSRIFSHPRPPRRLRALVSSERQREHGLAARGPGVTAVGLAANCG